MREKLAGEKQAKGDVSTSLRFARHDKKGKDPLDMTNPSIFTSIYPYYVSSTDAERSHHRINR